MATYTTETSAFPPGVFSPGQRMPLSAAYTRDGMGPLCNFLMALETDIISPELNKMAVFCSMYTVALEAESGLYRWVLLLFNEFTFPVAVKAEFRH